MSKYVEPVVKTTAQKEAEALLLKNAPDEDQMLREYLTKQANAAAAKGEHLTPCEQKVVTNAQSVKVEKASKAWHVINRWHCKVMSRLERARKARTKYS